MKEFLLVDLAIILFMVLLIYQLRSFNGFHPNAELLIGLLNQLGTESSKWLR